MSTHRIVLDPQYGYCAQCYEGPVHGWYALDSKGMTGVAAPDAVHFPEKYFASSIVEAGDRVNLHATSRGQKTVWRG